LPLLKFQPSYLLRNRQNRNTVHNITYGLELQSKTSVDILHLIFSSVFLCVSLKNIREIDDCISASPVRPITLRYCWQSFIQ